MSDKSDRGGFQRVELTRSDATQLSSESNLELHPQQRAAIEHRSSPLIVRGRAGTGKTTVLVEAAVSRIKGGQDPDSILFLTFGRERASEIRDRIALRAGVTMREPLARTFHALAFSLLKSANKADPSYLEPILLSGPEQETFIREIIDGIIHFHGKEFWPEELHKALTTDGFVREVRDLILRSSERGITFKELAEEGKKFSEPLWIAVAKFWEQYERSIALREGGSVDAKQRLDHSEIIGRAIALLKADPEFLNRIRQRFTTIIVDEFQESDPAQRQLLTLIAGQDVLIAVDAASAVGRFRGADPDGVEEALAPYLKNGKEITLSDVYRTPANPERFLFHSESEEAQFIAQQFKSAHLLHGISYSDMAVLLRSSGSMASALRRAFVHVGIPVAGYLDVLGKNPALAPFILLARVATGEHPLTAKTCEELLLAEFGGADSISLRRLRRSMLLSRPKGDERTGNQLLIDAIDKGEIFIEEQSALIRVHELLEAARRAARQKTATAEDVLSAIWDNARNSQNEKLADAWRREALSNSARSVIADRDLDAMIQLFDEAARFSERMPYAKPSLFLQQIAREDIAADIITSKGVRDQTVEILTVHAAKGREWKIVAIAGVQDGIWPNLKQRTSLLGAERLVEHLRYPDVPRDQLREIAASGLAHDEERLFNVALSRATDRVFVTAVSDEEDIPSTYFEELIPAQNGEELSIPYTVPERQLSQHALVAELRSVLQRKRTSKVGATADLKQSSGLISTSSEGDEALAASILKRLSHEGIATARPENWSGYRTISSTEPVVDPDKKVQVSPSGGEAFEECGLKWFLERQGGTDGESTAQLLGTVIHEFARIKAKDPSISTSDLYDKMEKAWAVIDSNTGWVARSGLQKAIGMIDRFITYHEDNLKERTIYDVEIPFEMTIGRAFVKGTADRIEVTQDGEFFIIDFKTGSREIGTKDVPTNLQLAAYQLAALLGRYKDQKEPKAVAGAELTYLAKELKTKISTRQQDALTLDRTAEVNERLEKLAEGMGGATFTAKVSEKCRECGVASSCPLQSQGRTVIS